MGKKIIKKNAQSCCSCSGNFQMLGWGCGESRNHLLAQGSRLSLLPATVPCPPRGLPAPKAPGFNQNHRISGPVLPRQTFTVPLNSRMLQTSQSSQKSPTGWTVSGHHPVLPGGAGGGRGMRVLPAALPACLRLQQPEGFVQSSRRPGWAFFIPGCSYVDILSCATGSGAAR